MATKMGAFDTNGIWKYSETDPASPFSDLLNLGMESVSNKIGDLQGLITALEAINAGWVNYTPTITALTTNPTGTFSDCKYKVIGSTVHARGQFTFTTGGSGSFLVTLPVPSAGPSTYTPMGTVMVRDSSAGATFMGYASYSPTNQFSLRIAGNSGNNSFFRAGDPFTIASGDTMYFHLTYEKA